MPEYAIDDPERFQSQIDAIRDKKNLFKDFQQELDDSERSIAGLRRRRRRVANSLGSPIKTVSLIEENGVLYWRDGIPVHTTGVRRRGQRRARAADDVPGSEVVFVDSFPTLAPNRIVDAIARLDRRLNPAIGEGLRSRLQILQRKADGTFHLTDAPTAKPFTGRTLLFVHGTFSNAANMLGEFSQPGEAGIDFLGRAMQGPKKYDRVLFFDHPTLAVSPVINALELGRALAHAEGQIDIIAHSRGGLVVRWWLEAFGRSLKVTPANRVRAILAGSPLHGTSLAAPDKIQNALSLISNIGTFAEKTLSLAGAANPFLWVAGKLVEVVVSFTGTLAKAPFVDGIVAVVPGLCGQSAVDNNYEINRLREGPVAVNPAYYAIMSNFETENPGWKFWRNFRKTRLADIATDVVFPGKNDLVVDTSSMKDFGVPQLSLAAAACDFGTSDTVWHCNYFRQKKTIDYIANTFGI